MEESERLLTVYRAASQPEAEIVRGKLTAEGVPAVLRYESLGSVCGLTIDGLGQVDIQVPAKYAEGAQQIISDVDDAEI